ncbi:MAG TPA: DNA-formamidopyrimidine glycosylase family protein [Acidimicrobiia bacterium]|jgi:formamidopyrimidine-DNA glycosylase
MAELPEIETLRRELDKELAGRKIKVVDVSAMKVIPRYRTKKAFTSMLEGRKISGLERRGPLLIAKLDATDALMIDLGAGGQLVRAKSARQTVSKSTMVAMTFTQGGQLRIVDPKGDSELWVIPWAEVAQAPELEGLGIDPLEAAMSWEQFGRRLYSQHEKLRTLLMDRRVLVGIGPVYADEILFAAGLRYDRESDQLTEQEVRRLYRAIVETMQEAVKFRGSTHAAKASSGDPFDDEGFEHFKVWERDGDACRRCRREIKKMRIGGRNHYYCEACQV